MNTGLDAGLDWISGCTSGCSLTTTEPGYLSGKAAFISNRSKRFHGIGQRIDGALFTAEAYTGKLFVKLLENPTEEITIVITLQTVKKSDNTKSYRDG